MPPTEFFALLAVLTGLESGVRDGINNDYLEPFGDTTATGFSVVPNLRILLLLSHSGVHSRYDDETLVSLLELRWTSPSESVSSSQPPNVLEYAVLDRRITGESVQKRLHELRDKGMWIEEPED
ncbi:hypothetical protein L218DRAFT_963632 [Marasmius fiardii PR-910]|nr:hypothetical protein L218DRAFT_963632 [Marasmius fiardii PR-910]